MSQGAAANLGEQHCRVLGPWLEQLPEAEAWDRSGPALRSSSASLVTQIARWQTSADGEVGSRPGRNRKDGSSMGGQGVGVGEDH